MKVDALFVRAVGERMADLRVNRAELARRMGCSRAYVTKVMQGECNLTARTMQRVATALGAELEIHVRSGRQQLT